MDIKTFVLAASTLVLSTSVNAVVINTLNGVGYQWLEFTETAGLSRNTVELRLADVNDPLYGYEYASRQLVADLLLSYTSWDGVDGIHGAPGVVQGITSYYDDFGSLYTDTGDGTNGTFYTVDGYAVLWDGFRNTRAIFGLTDECGGTATTCYTNMYLYYDANNSATGVTQKSPLGWDPLAGPAGTIDLSALSRYNGGQNQGSYLVRASVVPVPPAIWLFGSGLLGLIGVARRKMRA